MAGYQTDATFKTKDWEVVENKEGTYRAPEITYYVTQEVDTHYGCYTDYTQTFNIKFNNVDCVLELSEYLKEVDETKTVPSEALIFDQFIGFKVIDKKSKKIITYKVVKDKEEPLVD